MNAEGRFDDQVVIVTGGATGLGHAIQSRFLAEGAHVVVADVDEAALAQAEGPRVDAVRCDVTRAPAVRALVDGTLERHGRVDVLVNNAGVSSVALVVDLAEEEWQRVMDVNAKGTFLCCQAVLPSMLERRGGTIVNLASQAGKRGQRYIAHYCAAKAAVINFTRALALEAAPHVRANSVCPGTIATPMVERTIERQAELEGIDEAVLKQDAIEATPLGRLQQPADVAAAVAFLASRDAGEITGQALNVSGGVIMD
jgi:NAD(P)-dependent dehydrogenase (short-subunit alcohol dehydrogenase family)